MRPSMLERLLVKITSTKFIAFVVASVFCYLGIIDSEIWIKILIVYVGINQTQKVMLKR